MIQSNGFFKRVESERLQRPSPKGLSEFSPFCGQPPMGQKSTIKTLRMLHWSSFSRKHFDFQLSSLAFISRPECEGLMTLDLSLRESAEENKNTDTVNKNVTKVLVQSVP